MTTTTTIADLAARARQRQEEHERRLASDAEYRADYERLEASRREIEATAARQAARQRRAAIVAARSEKAIPEAFWPHLDAYRDASNTEALPASIEAAHALVTRFLNSAQREWVFLFLAGPPGVGKTTEACWFLDAPRVYEVRGPEGQLKRDVEESGGVFVTAAELAKASTYDAKFWGRVNDAQRLVVDDLGWEQLDGKGQALSNLAHLLCHRHAHLLPTVVTLNVTQAAFAERYAAHDGGRLRDRLAQSAWFAEITGPSLRRPLSIEGGAVGGGSP